MQDLVLVIRKIDAVLHEKLKSLNFITIDFISHVFFPKIKTPQMRNNLNRCGMYSEWYQRINNQSCLEYWHFCMQGRVELRDQKAWGGEDF